MVDPVILVGGTWFHIISGGFIASTLLQSLEPLWTAAVPCWIWWETNTLVLMPPVANSTVCSLITFRNASGAEHQGQGHPQQGNREPDFDASFRVREDCDFGCLQTNFAAQLFETNSQRYTPHPRYKNIVFTIHTQVYSSIYISLLQWTLFVNVGYKKCCWNSVISSPEISKFQEQVCYKRLAIW